MNERFIEIRKKLGLSQTNYAKRLGIPLGSINDIEHNRNKVSERTVALICYRLNVNEEWLRTGVGDMFSRSTEREVEELSKGLSAAHKRCFRQLLQMEADKFEFTRNQFEKLKAVFAEFGVTLD